MSKVYKDETGRKLVVDTGEVLTGKTVALVVKKPGGTEATWTGAVGAVNTTIEHTIATGDMNEAGNYILQAKITSGTDVSYGEAVAFTV